MTREDRGFAAVRGILIAVLSASVLGIGLLAPALGAPAVDDQAPAANPVRVEVVLDVSGSMQQSPGGAVTRLDAARTALSELAFSLPRQTTQMGVRVYGADYGGTDRARSCVDSRVLVPIRPLAPARLVDQVAKLVPTGDTPIAHALTEAARDFPPTDEDTRDVVVLISDGEDNCSPADFPPCRAVRELNKQGFEIRIETVGVSLGGNTKARDQLQCIADVTGGQYYDADDFDALGAALKRIGEQSLGRLPKGKPIEGAAKRGRATLIEPGDYNITIRPGQVHWFEFDAEPGTQPRASVSLKGVDDWPVAREDQYCRSWRAALVNPAGEGLKYPPYGNSGIFDGPGFGSTGASTTGLLAHGSTGIDYPGRWQLSVSLGFDPNGQPLDCAERLPQRPLEASLTLQIDDELMAPEEPEATESVEPTPTPEASPEAEVDAGPSPADKYVLPETEDNWSGPILAVLVAAAIIGLGFLLFRMRQRRVRGW